MFVHFVNGGALFLEQRSLPHEVHILQVSSCCKVLSKTIRTPPRTPFVENAWLLPQLKVFCLIWNHRHLATIDLDCEWAPRRHGLDMCHSKWIASTNVLLQNIHIELVCTRSGTGGDWPGCNVKSQRALTGAAGSSRLLFLSLLFLRQKEAFFHDTAMYQNESIYPGPLRTKCCSNTLEWCPQR